MHVVDILPVAQRLITEHRRKGKNVTDKEYFNNSFWKAGVIHLVELSTGVFPWRRHVGFSIKI